MEENQDGGNFMGLIINSNVKDNLMTIYLSVAHDPLIIINSYFTIQNI